MPTTGAIIILGYSNDANGRLTSNSRLRTDRAIELLRKLPGYKLLPTGGYGIHFNTTDKPHSWHIRQYLVEKGVTNEEILPIVESDNTIGDAKMSKEIIDSLDIKNVIVITSDFHTMRASLIFRRVFGKNKFSIDKVPNTLNPLEKFFRYFHEYKQTIRIILGVIPV